jgi:hypothetical protein
MVSVLAIGSKVRSFITGQGGGFLRAIKTPPSFGREVKPAAPYTKIVRHVKNPEYERDIW